MKIIQSFGKEELAIVHTGETSQGSWVEFVESLQPPLPREEKWVLIVSTMDGCPVKCAFCDAGGVYRRNLGSEEMLEQIDYMVNRRYDSSIDVKKFKVQFARIGEPSLNPSVLETLEALPLRYDAPGLLPSISTIAPAGSKAFFEKLYSIKERLYRGRFQLQFSIHSTDKVQRDSLIPFRKWSLEQIAEYGSGFCGTKDRKITLNFALSTESVVDHNVISATFDPEKFLIKITPVNPTYRSHEKGLKSAVEDNGTLTVHSSLLEVLREKGFDVIVSVGEPEENKIGSNCGLFIRRHLNGSMENPEMYSLVKPNNDPKYLDETQNSDQTPF
ncbi:MAG: radical SAM protein [Mesotoga sp.]|uniref:radical SAM protein n=1 Tax=Mesotoga sp. TaxID=2053577 RepID=UPI003568BA10